MEHYITSSFPIVFLHGHSTSQAPWTDTEYCVVVMEMRCYLQLNTRPLNPSERPSKTEKEERAQSPPPVEKKPPRSRHEEMEVDVREEQPREAKKDIRRCVCVEGWVFL